MRLNITLPDSLAKELQEVSNKSSYIAEALREKIKKEKKAVLLRELQEGYRATKQEDAEINREWEETTVREWE